MAQQIAKKNDELEVYVVTVDLIGIQKLAPQNNSDSLDTYCKIIVLDSEYKTDIISNSLNPSYNETYKFNSFIQPKNVRIELYNNNSHKNIGYAEYSLNKFKPFNGNIKLKQAQAQGTATIKIKVNAMKILPNKLKNDSNKQRNIITKRNQTLNNLKQENKQLKQENNRIKNKYRNINYNIQPGSQLNNDNKVPTKRLDDNKLYTSIINVILFFHNMWCYLLINYVYSFPFGVGYYINIFILCIGSLFRLLTGNCVLNGSLTSKKPIKLLKLYDIENDIECKRVREILSSLDLNCLIYPCPIGLQSRFRDAALRHLRDGSNKDGKLVLPMFIDDNFGDDKPIVITGSNNIIKFLYQEYGNNVELNKFDKLRYYISSHKYSVLIYKYLFLNILRGSNNKILCKTNEAPKALELYSYESSPHCMYVREILCSLEIPYILKNIAIGSKQKRDKFKIEYGTKYSKWKKVLDLIQVPMLIDPNTDKQFLDSKDIKKYLLETYTA